VVKRIYDEQTKKTSTKPWNKREERITAELIF
jgi:hypothetical protein